MQKGKRVAILAELLQHSPDRASYEDLLADYCVIRKDIDPCEKGLTHSKDGKAMPCCLVRCRLLCSLQVLCAVLICVIALQH